MNIRWYVVYLLSCIRDHHTHFTQYIERIHCEMRMPIRNECMAALGIFIEYLPRHCEDFSVIFESQACGDDGPTIFRRLEHYGPETEARNDAVPFGKCVLRRLGIQRIFAEEQPAILTDLRREFL